MATTIVTKNSATSGSAPGAGALSQGELAVNVADKRLYTKNSGGSVVEVGTNPGGAVTFTAGTASAPAITTTGDTNTGIFFPAADTIAFSEGGTESMRIDASGNLGLGVTPSAWSLGKAVEVNSAGNAVWSAGPADIRLNAGAYYDGAYKYGNTGSSVATYEIGGGTHIWRTAGSGTAGNAITFTQAMTLDADGDLGIGTSSPSSRLNVVSGTATGAAFGSNQYIRLDGSNGASYTAAIATTGNQTSGYYFSTNNAYEGGMDYEGTSRFMTFRTANAERMRIDSSGNLLVGTTSNYGNITSQQTDGGYANAGLTLVRSANTNRWNFLIANDNNLYLGYNEADRGFFNNSTGAYSAVSDSRLKKNIADISYGLNEILALRSVAYNMNEQDDTEVKTLGFIAQEAIQVIPESVSEMMSGMYGMDKVAIIPVLVKAIQELKAEVDSLKAQVENK